MPLQHGPYPPPDTQVGDSLFCHSRKRMVVVAGFQNGWPMASFRPGRLSHILCDQLVAILKAEFRLSVAEYFGVSPCTINAWRKRTGCGGPRKTFPDRGKNVRLPGFGARLRDARRKSKVTIQRLADAAGVSPSEILYLEAEKRWPSFALAIRLADALGVPLDRLRPE